MISKCENGSNVDQNSFFTRPIFKPIGSKESDQNDDSSTFTQVQASYKTSYALTSGGLVYSWVMEKEDLPRQSDSNNISADLTVPVPRPIIGKMKGHRIALISAGHQHCLALSSGGRVFAWGRNNHGQLGIGQTSCASEYVKEPSLVQFPKITVVTKVSAGHFHSVALINMARSNSKTETIVFGWGNSQYLGEVKSIKRCKIEPQEILSITKKIKMMEEPDGPQRDKKKCIQLTALSAGGFHNLVLTKCGLVLAWGSGTYGQLGNGHVWDLSKRPMIVAQLKNVVHISAGLRHSFAIVQKPGDKERKVFGWGYNCNGELGLKAGDCDVRLQPYEITTMDGYCMLISAGYRHSIRHLA